MDHRPQHEGGMTGAARWAGVVAALLLWPATASTGAVVSAVIALPLEITRSADTTAASCTLIARDDQPGVVNLYFITAARLFVAPADDRAQPVSSVVIDAPRRHLVVGPDDVTLPTGTLLDLALLRVTVATSDLVPLTLAFTPPVPGQPFTISGVATNGATVDIVEHVRFTSTLFAVGDRDASRLVGCIGSAAVGPAGTFGIVTSCEPLKAPIVTLIGAARGFLERHVRSMRTGRITS